MSTRKGAGNTRTRKPAHQNSFAFRHNPKSQKTAKILGSANTGLCASCHDKVSSSDRQPGSQPGRQATIKQTGGRTYAVLVIPGRLKSGRAKCNRVLHNKVPRAVNQQCCYLPGMYELCFAARGIL